jgi:hypothetical protein
LFQLQEIQFYSTKNSILKRGEKVKTMMTILIGLFVSLHGSLAKAQEASETFVIPKKFLSVPDPLGIRKIKNFEGLKKFIDSQAKTEMECDEWNDAGFGVWKATEVRKDSKPGRGQALVVKYFSPCEEYSASTGVLMVSPDSRQWFVIPSVPGYNLRLLSVNETTEAFAQTVTRTWKVITTKELNPSSAESSFELQFREEIKTGAVRFLSVRSN